MDFKNYLHYIKTDTDRHALTFTCFSASPENFDFTTLNIIQFLNCEGLDDIVTCIWINFMCIYLQDVWGKPLCPADTQWSSISLSLCFHNISISLLWETRSDKCHSDLWGTKEKTDGVLKTRHTQSQMFSGQNLDENTHTHRYLLTELLWSWPWRSVDLLRRFLIKAERQLWTENTPSGHQTNIYLLHLEIN